VDTNVELISPEIAKQMLKGNIKTEKSGRVLLPFMLQK